jgi:hypothetical protein
VVRLQDRFVGLGIHLQDAGEVERHLARDHEYHPSVGSDSNDVGADVAEAILVVAISRLAVRGQ